MKGGEKNCPHFNALLPALCLILFAGVPPARAQLSAAGQTLADRALHFSAAGSRHPVKFERADNFRDLGGYPNAAGTHRIRFGLLYRSARLAKIKDRDRKILQELGVQRVCDFRGDRERRRRPLHLPENIRVTEYPVEHITEKELRRAVAKSSPRSPFDGAEFMEDYYRRLVREFTPVYGEWLRSLLGRPPAPQVFQGGVGGKDRVGFASAVLLRTLDAPWDIVQGDYLLSAIHGWRKKEKRMRQIRMYAAFRRGLEAENVYPVLTVRQSFLHAAFDEIDAQYGSFENYLRLGLKVSAQEQRELQRLYLESIPPPPATTETSAPGKPR